ncbi:hypothetical protein V3C99_002721 [Haemonchus contortus]
MFRFNYKYKFFPGQSMTSQRLTLAICRRSPRMRLRKFNFVPSDVGRNPSPWQGMESRRLRELLDRVIKPCCCLFALRIRKKSSATPISSGLTSKESSFSIKPKIPSWNLTRGSWRTTTSRLLSCHIFRRT